MVGAGAMADFARMPTQRKVLVFAVIGLVMGLLYWKLIYRSLEDDLQTARAEHETKTQTNKRLAGDIPKYAELRTHMERLRVLIEKNQTALPSEAELPAFFETLQQKIAESGVEMHRWTNRSEEPVERFVKVPVEIEITGSFLQIKRFFASLVQPDVRPSAAAASDRASEEHERIVSVENLALGSPTVKNREIILNAKFTAVTFRQEDKPAAQVKSPNGPPTPAVAPPAGAPSQPRPAPVAPGPAPPPLPSAATPAGAKARLDRASDKADARNRTASDVDEAKPPVAGRDRLKGGL
jgi:type IV pilus assembly protein PilO